MVLVYNVVVAKWVFKLNFLNEIYNNYYSMASSASGQDESNPALWLATRAGKMELSCPLGTTRRVPQEKFPRKPYNKSFIDQACLVKMAGYWPRSCFASLWTSTPSRSINSQKKELGQYPAILTSHLVNNQYLLSHIMGTTPILEMARAYGLRPRLWLLVMIRTLVESHTSTFNKKYKKAFYFDTKKND